MSDESRLLRLIENRGQHYASQLPPSERIKHLLVGYDGRLSDIASACLSVYPDECTAEEHKHLPWKVRFISRIGVWCQALATTLAYRKAARKRHA